MAGEPNTYSDGDVDEIIADLSKRIAELEAAGAAAVSKVDHIHAIDDGKMTDAEIALIVGCHRAYVRSVRQISKKQSAQVVAKSKVRASLKARITELERVCAELYQVLGSLSDSTELFDHPDVIRALDQASQARVVHDDLLPWPREALTKSNDKP